MYSFGVNLINKYKYLYVINIMNNRWLFYRLINWWMKSFFARDIGNPGN
jgi:hypothetical protein